jgi:lipoprotein-anchoring transpeptidase ErfK/SrfK
MMVKRPVLLLILAMTLVACAGPASAPATTPGRVEVDNTDSAAISDDPPPGTPGPIETRAVWAGFAATDEDPGDLAAYLHGPLDVYESPDQDVPMLTIDPATILGTVTVLAVVDGPRDGWVEVMLPTRPNGSTGWAHSDEVSLFVADGRIVVDLGNRELSYVVDGVEVLHTTVGIGSKYNQTPVGHFFVTDVVTLANPNSAWGPHALGLSARSDTITEFNGGDGIIGIHGTNNPSSIGANISLGCVRLPNDMITALYGMVPIGTRVEITA